MAYKVEARVGIAAPVDDVYELLEDINSWPQWSPIHRKAEGVLRFGAPVHLEEYFEGLGLWEVDGFIADWTPLSHIHITIPKRFYEGSLIHYYELEALSGHGTVFAVGAMFSGFLSEREGRRYGKYMRTGFDAFGQAIKDKAEAKFALNPDRLRNSDPAVVPSEPKKPQLGPAPSRIVLPNFFGMKKRK